MLARIASGLPCGQHRAFGHHRHPVGDREHEVHVVLDQQHGVLARQALQQRDHALRFLGAHAGQRLVQQQHLGLAGQRHGDLELALLAVRQGTPAMRLASVRPARPGPRPAAAALDQGCVALRRLQRIARAARHRLHGEPHVLQHASAGQRCWCAGTSGRRRDRLMRQAGSPATSRPSSTMRPGARLELAREHVDERGLAGAVGADDGVQLALMQRNGDVAHGREPAEVAAEPCVASTAARWRALQRPQPWRARLGRRPSAVDAVAARRTPARQDRDAAQALGQGRARPAE